ncbi:hypothetical protein [Anaerosinus gibii]|uniref:Superinfection exclusion protein n=1 Tax=Selenobaculum gibii TaxID=3054208 RepID=A0A9Y2AJE8_9FIRM|nr:hypothetical protein [Selenobaculum gbiensis]WIW70926.1 hypothetical protein P3F81_00970 [Selenobaculum gbiensis]
MKKLRVCHVPPTACNPFIIDVANLKEAKKIMDTLAEYDKFQYENNLPQNSSSTSTLEEYSECEKKWIDWCDEESGIDHIEEYFKYLEHKHD